MSVSKRKIKQIPLAYSANIVVPLWPRCLKQRWTAGDTPVVIVLDNTRYQHCQAVKDKTEQLGINLIFLRPYSPKLKIIERLWKYTRRHVFAGKYFYSPARFHDVLKHFFEVDYINHKQNLSSLLTLNSQSFENAHLLCA